MIVTNLGIVDKLTISYILERVTQEELMEKYIGVPVNNLTLLPNSVLSPFRQDTNPTCNYYYLIDKTGYAKLRFRDWDGTFKGDCFDAAAQTLKVNISNKQGFALLLNKIASDFKIHKYKDGSEVVKLETFYKSYKVSNDLKIYKIEPRAMTSYDVRFWKDVNGIDIATLKKGLVYMVKNLYIQNEEGDLIKTYRYRSSDPAYAYFGGKLNGVGLWKIYYPYRKVNRFTANYAFIYGHTFFVPSSVGIITKSYKDVLAYSTFNVSAISVPSETYLMKPDEIFNLKSKVDILLTNFDYDRAGILLAQKYKRIYNIHPIMLTKGRFNQPNYGAKDFTDYIAANGRDNTKKLIETIENKYEEEINFFITYNHNALKNIL
jgi:hypothetical protein